MSNCASPIIKNDVQVGEICHIKARNARGPRYDATLTAKAKDEDCNLLLLCRTCHKIVDSQPAYYTAERLAQIKKDHETHGFAEITPEIAREAALLLPKAKAGSKVTARASRSAVAISVGGDNHAPITVNQTTTATKEPKSKYPSNAIGADANMSGYIEYLFGRGIDYWKSVPDMNPGRLGKKIKTKFRLGTRTRLFVPVQRFHELVDFIISDILLPSPVGKKHARNGTKLCRTFDEWQYS